MTIQITEIDAVELSARLERFTDILVQSVDTGAAISFMAPLARKDAAEFWLQSVRPEVEAGRRILLGAKRGDALLGTVQLVIAMPPNQSHRAEISKMIVHPEARRMGIGRALMTAALEHAPSLGKTLVTLDTRTGDVAEPLYASVGFQVAGVIPDFAWDADGKAKHATTYMFCPL